jgi:hypothetical protein
MLKCFVLALFTRDKIDQLKHETHYGSDSPKHPRHAGPTMLRCTPAGAPKHLRHGLPSRFRCTSPPCTSVRVPLHPRRGSAASPSGFRAHHPTGDIRRTNGGNPVAHRPRGPVTLPTDKIRRNGLLWYGCAQLRMHMLSCFLVAM